MVTAMIRRSMEVMNGIEFQIMVGVCALIYVGWTLYQRQVAENQRRAFFSATPAPAMPDILHAKPDLHHHDKSHSSSWEPLPGRGCVVRTSARCGRISSSRARSLNRRFLEQWWAPAASSARRGSELW